MSDNKVLKSSIMIIFLTIIGKLLAIVRDSLLSAKFGTTYSTDIYVYAIGLIYLLTTISYGLTATFIPLHTENIETKSKKESNFFVNNVLNSFTIFTIILTIALIVFAKYIVLFSAPGFKDNLGVFNQCVTITRIMLLSLLFISIQSVITGVLQTHKKFFAPASMAVVSNIVYILYLGLLSDKYGIIGFGVAIVFGFFAQLIINLPQYKLLGYKYKPEMNLKDSSLNKLVKLMLPVVISTAVLQLNLFVNRAFATAMFEGAPTILDFANKLNTLGYEVFAIAISMVVYPILSTFVVQKNKEEYKKSFTSAFNSLLMIMIPVAIGMAILRIPIINIIYKRGEFTQASADLTARTLLFYTPAMIAYALRDILNKAFYSIKDTKTPMINSLIGIVINVILDILLFKTMKVSSLAAATSISIIITTIILIYKLQKRIGNLDIKSMCTTFIKIFISAAVMGILVYLTNNIILTMIGSGMKGSIISVLISFIIGVLSYSMCIALVKVKEFTYLISTVKAKLH